MNEEVFYIALENLFSGQYTTMGPCTSIVTSLQTLVITHMLTPYFPSSKQRIKIYTCYDSGTPRSKPYMLNDFVCFLFHLFFKMTLIWSVNLFLGRLQSTLPLLHVILVHTVLKSHCIFLNLSFTCCRCFSRLVVHDVQPHSHTDGGHHVPTVCETRPCLYEEETSYATQQNNYVLQFNTSCTVNRTLL